MNFLCNAKNLSGDGKLVNIGFSVPGSGQGLGGPVAGGSISLTVPIANEGEYAIGSTYAMTLVKQ